MQLAPRISAATDVCHGQPVVAGTRVLVSVVVRDVGLGIALDEVAAQYDITREDVQACVAYAASIVAGEQYRAM